MTAASQQSPRGCLAELLFQSVQSGGKIEPSKIALLCCMYGQANAQVSTVKTAEVFIAPQHGTYKPHHVSKTVFVSTVGIDGTSKLF